MEVKARLIAGTKPRVERESQGQNMQMNLFHKGFQEPELELGCTGTQVNPRLSNLLSIARKYLLKALKRVCELNLAEPKVTAKF